MSKYLRAIEALRSDPVGSVSQMNVCLTRENDKIWARLVHPGFTLEIRMDERLQPRLAAPVHETQEVGEDVVAALEKALLTASDGRSGLSGALLAYRPPEDWKGICALRLLLRTGIVWGEAGGPAAQQPLKRDHLQLVADDTQDSEKMRVAP